MHFTRLFFSAIAITSIALVFISGCDSDLTINEDFEIDCDGTPCDWRVVEGELGHVSWHENDRGLNLSKAGRHVIEQQNGPFYLTKRELFLSASIAKAPENTVRFEFDWYVSTQRNAPETGPTYWDREPKLLETRSLTVRESGYFMLDERISTPDIAVDGFVMRIIKEGDSDLAIIDNVELRRFDY